MTNHEVLSILVNKPQYKAELTKIDQLVCVCCALIMISGVITLITISAITNEIGNGNWVFTVPAGATVSFVYWITRRFNSRSSQ